MTTSDTQPPASSWFRPLLDSADDVYFRYSLVPSRGFVYLSPSIEALTGHPSSAFVANPALCLGILPRADRRILFQILRASRGLTSRLTLTRDGVALPVSVRTVAVRHGRRVVAVEGMIRAASAQPDTATEAPLPVEQRLTALLHDVHTLLHQVMPRHSHDAQVAPRRRTVLRVAGLEFDDERLTANEDGRPVDLTSREAMVLRYLLARPGRVITRKQLLEDVWGYHYTGDDRTVDVHVSRLRRKLPSLAARLVAVKHVGYRLDAEVESAA